MGLTPRVLAIVYRRRGGGKRRRGVLRGQRQGTLFVVHWFRLPWLSLILPTHIKQCPHLGLPMKRGTYGGRCLNQPTDQRYLRAFLPDSIEIETSKRPLPTHKHYPNARRRHHRGGRGARHSVQFPPFQVLHGHRHLQGLVRVRLRNPWIGGPWLFRYVLVVVCILYICGRMNSL